MLIKALREVLDCPLLDMDDELLRLNGGVWPPLELKRGLSSQVIDELSRLGDVVLAYSVLDDEQLGALIAAEWVICLLDLPEEVMRHRADERLAREVGPTSNGCPSTWTPSKTFGHGRSSPMLLTRRCQ